MAHVGGHHGSQRMSTPPKWHILAIRLPIAGGSDAWAITIVDEHAVSVLAAGAFPEPSPEAAWQVMAEALGGHTPPGRIVCAGALIAARQGETMFGQWLSDQGVSLESAAKCSTEGGEVLQRYHRQVTAYCTDRGPAADVEQLQGMLNAFRRAYNAVSRPPR